MDQKVEYPDRRVQLHYLLCDVLGSSNVYFQPPETIKMSYPAIVYSLDDIRSNYADNGVYSSFRRYQVTLIDSDPDSEVLGKLAEIPTCRYNRHYTSDNLNHDVYVLYY